MAYHTTIAQSLGCPPIFEGLDGDDFHTWVDRFEQYTLAEEIPNKAVEFHKFLGNAAYKLYRGIAEKDRRKYDTVKKVFSDAFHSESITDACRAQFGQRRREKKENLAVYASELRELAGRAYPKYNTEARSDLVLRQFLGGIENGEKISRKDPKTIEKAIELASKLECRLKVEREGTVNAVCEGQEEEISGFRGLNKQVELLTEQMGVFSAQMDKMSQGARGQGLDNSVTKCYNCGEAGHFKRECPKLQGYSKRGDRGGRGRGVGRGTSSPKVRKSFLRCYRCGGLGHMARDCASQSLNE